MPSGPKKRRAARNKNRGNQNNGADLEGEENAFIESTSMEVQDGLAVKDGAAHVELATPVDAASSKEVVLNQNVGLEDVLELGLKENDGKEVSEHVLDSSLEEGKGKELPSEVLDLSLEKGKGKEVPSEVLDSSLGKGKEVPVEVLDSGSKENDDKPVEEDALVEPILTEVEDRLVVINDGVYIDLAEPVDALSPRGIILVQDVGSKDGKDVIDEHVLDSGPKENDEVKENALIEQTSVEMEDELAVKNDAANYVELAEPDEALSPRGIVFIRDVGSEDVFELAGLTENDGKEVIKEVLDSSLEEDDGKESLPPAAEALESSRVLKVEENALIKPTSIEVEDGLAVKTTAANVELSEPIDALFSKEVVQNVGSEDVFELGSKEVDVKEVIKDVVDSSLDEAFVQDVGSEENDHKSVEENALIEPTSIDQVEDELAEPVDVFSPRGIVFVQDVGSEDVFELGSKENYGKEVSKEVLDSSLEEDDGEEPPAEVLDSGPILKVEENALIEPTSIEVEDGLAVKIAAADVELAEPVDAVSSKEVILVQNVGSEDVFDMGWTEIDVKEVIEDSLDSSLGEDEWKEPPAKVLDSSPMENDEKPVEQSTFIEPTLVEVEDGLVVNKKTIAADVEVSEAIDGLFSKEVVLAQNLGSEDVSELGSNEIDVKEVNEDVLDSILKEDELNETPAEVPDSGPNENGEKPVEESALIESTPVEAEDVLVVEPVTADVDELAEPVDAHSSKGVLLVQDEGFEDAFELGSNVSDETEVFEDVLDSSPEKDEGSKPPAEVRISDPKENDDKQVEENVLIKPTSIELEDGLAVKTAAEDVELAEPVDAIVTKEIVLVQDVGSEDIFELGLKENNGEDVIKDVLDSSLEKDDGKEPPAEVNGSGPKENDEKPVEEDNLTKPTSIEVENGLVVETPAANVELAEPVDALSTLSSEGVLLAKNVGSKDVFELTSKEEVIEDVLDSSLKEDDGKESPSEVPETGPILKDEENTFIDPTSVKGEDGLVVKAASTDVELAESIDVLSFRGFLVQDVGSEDVSELGLNEHYGGEVIKHVLDSSLEEDEQKEPHREILDSGPKENEDKPAADSVFINPTLVEVEDGLAVKIAAGDVELAEPVDNISSRGVIFVQDVGSENVSALGSKENDGREDIEDVLDSSLAEDEQKEQHVEILDSGPKENDDKPVGDSALIEPTSVEMEDAMAVETAAGDVELAERLHDISSRGVVLVEDIGSEEVLELGTEESDGKELTEDVLDSSLENDKWKEPHAEVNDTPPKENDNEPVEEDALVKTTSIELEDGLALTTAADVELAEPVDTLSSRSVLVQDGGFEDVFELGLKEKDEKEGEDVFDSSLEKDEGKEPPCEVNDSCLKENVDNPVEENAIIEPNAIKLDDALAMTTGVDDAELAKPVDALSSKGVALFKDIRFEDVFELGYEENDDNPVEEDVLIAPNSIELEYGSASTTAAIDVELAGSIDALSYKGVSFVHDRGFDDSSLEKVVGKEAPVEFNDSGLKENDDKPVEEDGLIEPTSIELELEDGLGVTTASDVELVEPLDAISSEGFVLDRDVGFEDVFEFVLKETDGKEVIQDVLDSSSKEDDGEEPPAEVLGSGPVLEVEEDALSDPTSIDLELEDGLAATTAGGVELAEPVDALFSKGVFLDRDGGFENVFELGLKKNDGKEESEDDVLHSSSEEDDEEEPPEEVLGSGSILKDEENTFIDPTSVKGEDGLVVKAASTDVELAESIDVLSFRGFLVQDVGSEDVSELGLNEHYGGEVIKHVLDSSLEEDEQKEPHREILDSGPKENEDKPAVESAFINPTLVEVEDGLAVKIAAGDVELAEPVDNISSRGVIFVQDVGSEDVSAKENDGREVIEDVLDSSLAEDEQKEQHVEILDSGPKENEDKSVGDSALIETTSVEMEDAMAVETAAGDVELVERLHDISSRGVVLVQDIGSEDVLELGSEESDGKELTEDVLDSSLENDKWKEPHAEVNDIRPKENDNEPVEEDALVKTTSIELEDGLALTTAADVELTEPVDTLSNRSVLVQDGGFEDVFELGLKEKDEKEVEDVFDSSLEKDEWKEPPCEVNDSCLKENVDNPVEENAIIEPNAIKLDYGLAMTTGVDDAELAKPVDALFQDIRFEDVFELGYEENDDNPVEEDALIAPNSIKLEHGSASTTAAIDIELAGSIDALSYKGVSFVQDRGFDDSSLEKVVGKEAPVEFNYSGLKENDDKPVEEDGLIEPTSTELELEDGLGVTTASDVELAEPRDAFSSEGVVLDRDVGFEDVFEFVSKENDGKEVIQDFLDSSSKEDDGEEPPAEFLGSGPVLEVEKDALSDPTSIELELEDGLAATTAGGVELAEPVDALFSKGVVLDRDGGFEDVFELGLKKNDGKEESKDDVLNSSSEEDDEEEPPEEVLGSGSILKVLFSKYFFTLLCIVVMLVVWKQQFVLLLSTCSTGSSWSPLLSPIGPHHHEYQSMETDEALVLENADDVADLSEPPDTCPSKGAVLEICSKKDNWKDLFEGKEAANEVLDSAPKENEGKERAEEVIDSGSNKIDNKPVVEDPSTDELELASKETERKELTSVVGGDTLHSPSLVESDSTEDDSFLSKEVVKNVLELGSKKDEGRELVEEVLELGQKENVGQPKVEDPLADELELASDSNKTSGKEMASFLGRDPFDSPSVVSPIASVEDDTVLSREIVQNAFFKEPAEEVLDSVLNENDDKSVVEDPLTDELELESDSQEIKKKELAFVVGGDPLDSPTKDDSTDSMDGDSVVSVELNEKPCVENKVAKRNVGADGEDLLALVKGVRKTIEEQLIVVEEMRASLRQLLDSVNLIRTTIQG